MKIYQIFLLLLLWSCRSNETPNISDYSRDMWIHDYLMSNQALHDLKSDSISSEANVVVAYVDSILNRIQGLDIERDRSYSALVQLDSLLAYKTNTALFYGTEYSNPKKDDYSFLNLKTKVEAYLKIEENNQLGEIIFPQFKQGELKHYK